MLLKKIVKRFFLYFLIPFILSVVSFLLLNQPLYTGTLQFDRTLNPVTIKRDQYGIPTIEGKTFNDVSYGLGFAHAQDRLWYILFRKRLFAGRMAEIFGENGIPIDKFMRTLSLERYARASLEYLEQDTLEQLQAYVDGFNDAISSMRVLPIDFYLTWSYVERLEIVDVITAVKGVSYFLTFGYLSEVVYARLEDVLGADKLKELLPSEPQHFMWSNVTVLNDEDLKQTGIFEAFNHSKPLSTPEGQEFPPERQAPRSPTIITMLPDEEDNTQKQGQEPVKDRQGQQEQVLVQEKGQIGGSNAWVIHGKHTSTGKPIIANDPHLSNGMPSFWYNAALITEDNYVSGVSIPGCPYIAIGKTKHVAWGFTANMMDTGDLYNVTVKGNMYYYNGHWFPLKRIPEKIYIKSKMKPVVIDVYETHHGVILDSYLMEFFGKKGYQVREGERLALAWMGYHNNETTPEVFKRIPFVKTAEEMVDIWQHTTQLYMNLHFATTAGDIGYILLGKIPIRRATSQGIRPLDGSLKENDWLGWVPWEDQPRVINPKKGYIVSANNKVATDNVKWHSTYRSMSTARAVRIEEMLNDFISKNTKISVEDVRKMQIDVLDVMAREAVPVIVKCAREALRLGYTTSLVHLNKLNQLIDELERWDYRMEKESAAAAILTIWELQFKHKTLFGLKMEEETRKTFINETIYEHFIFKKVISWGSLDPAQFDEYWCLNPENEGKSNPCLYNLVKALEETWVYLEKHIGNDLKSWEWQKIHTDEYPHGPFSNTLFKRFFHRSIPSSGNGRTVRVSLMPKGQLAGSWSANMRAIFSLEGEDHSYAVLDTGVSGNVNSPHYDDQMKVHQAGELIKIQEKRLESWKEKLDITFGAKE